MVPMNTLRGGASEEGLILLSGMQQPPRPNSEDDAEAWEEEYVKSEKRVKEIAQDISCALTGSPE